MHNKDLEELRRIVLITVESLRSVADNLERAADIMMVLDASEEARAGGKRSSDDR